MHLKSSILFQFCPPSILSGRVKNEVEKKKKKWSKIQKEGRNQVNKRKTRVMRLFIRRENKKKKNEHKNIGFKYRKKKVVGRWGTGKDVDMLNGKVIFNSKKIIWTMSGLGSRCGRN